MRGISRRSLIRKAAGIVAMPYVVRAASLGSAASPAASNRITMGVIGTGNQGTNDLRGFLEDERVQIVAICDVNRGSAGYWDGAVAGREPAKRIVEQRYTASFGAAEYKGCDACEDFREVIARNDIDTLLIALPDHWHSIPVVMGARAGKDMYCEKPLSLTIHEGRIMSDTVRRYKRVFQTGSQQRSDANFRLACELTRNERIGKLQTVKVGLPGGLWDIARIGDHKKPEPIPAGFDYDMWLGPAPWQPYCASRCHVNYRWIFDYSGGQLTDWGGHHPDIAQWGMGTDHTGPIEIVNARGRYANDVLWNTATEFYFECIYGSGVRMLVSHRFRGGVAFEGTDGWVWVNRGAIDAKPKSILSSAIGPNDINLYKSDNHYRNFIDCVISRKDPIAPVETGHRSITIAHLGNIALKLGRNLKWDPDKEIFPDDAEANKHLRRAMRSPWQL